MCRAGCSVLWRLGEEDSYSFRWRNLRPCRIFQTKHLQGGRRRGAAAGAPERIRVLRTRKLHVLYTEAGRDRASLFMLGRPQHARIRNVRYQVTNNNPICNGTSDNLAACNSERKMIRFCVHLAESCERGRASRRRCCCSCRCY